jgi:hypothetical protein
MLTLVFLALSPAPVPDATSIQTARAAVLQRALRGMDLLALAKAPAVARRRESGEEPVRRCAIRLLEFPADRSIDPKMILRAPLGPPPDHMPFYEGLPPCPRRR